MIENICKNRKLEKYLGHHIEDAGMVVKVDSSLSEKEYIGIKVDDYYGGLHLGKETPKAVDFVVAVDCQCQAYALYVLELKNVSRPKAYTKKEICEKFDTAINRFLKRDFSDIFLNDRYKYKAIKLYLVTSAYKEAMNSKNYEEYRKMLQKANKKDSLTKDQYLSDKPFLFRKKVLHIEREIPPNPVIRRIL